MNYVGIICIIYPRAERISTILTEIASQISRQEIWLEGFGEASVENRTYAIHGGARLKSKQWRDRKDKPRIHSKFGAYLGCTTQPCLSE